jgi:uncharacterized protein YndB with AHSA1/START domain
LRALVLALTSVLALAVVGAASAEFPTKRSDPSVRGTPQEGQTLNGQTGQWLDANGLPCTDCKLTYTWQRCNPDLSGCTDIAGVTGFTYTLGAADVGKRIRFIEWIYKRDCGEWNYSTGTQECADVTKNGASFPTNVVTPKPVSTPQFTGTPTVQGTPMEDEILNATGATWTGQGTITKAFFWQRCNTAGEGCATIPGAIGSAYRLTSGDVNGRIRVVETATNEGGTSQAVSAVTDAVDELMPTARRQTLPVTKVAPPHRLVLNQVIAQQRESTVTLRVKISDDRGFRVSGVQVRVTPTSLLAGSTAAQMSRADGWATFTFRATGTGTTYVFVDARRKGEKAQAGISTSNLFKIRVR